MKTSHLIYHEIFKYFNKNIIILVGLRWNETSWKNTKILTDSLQIICFVAQMLFYTCMQGW